MAVIDDIVKIKQTQRIELERKLDNLTKSSIEVSYDLNLTKAEQIMFGNLGAYSFWYDEKFYGRRYGD